MVTRTVDRIDIISLTVFVGTISLCWGVGVALARLVVAGAFGGPAPGGLEVLVLTVGSLGTGVVGGAGTAVIYNAVANLVGGLELELSGD